MYHQGDRSEHWRWGGFSISSVTLASSQLGYLVSAQSSINISRGFHEGSFGIHNTAVLFACSLGMADTSPGRVCGGVHVCWHGHGAAVCSKEAFVR
jgi:hypothetical protein